MRIAAKYDNAVLAAPMVLFLLAFLGFPAVVDIIYSFSDVNFETLRSPELSGIGNYTAVIADEEFWQAAWFSLKFGFLTALAECFLGLFLAVFLAPLLTKRSWLLAILMMPMMVAPAMVGLMYRLVLHEFVGPLPYYLYMWLGDSPSFLNRENVFSTLLVIETLQWTPFAFLLFYVAYRAIPGDMREAAMMDGARSWAMLRYIELPQLMPTIAIAFFIRFIDGFRVFDNIFVLTGSGAGGSTTSMSIYIYLAFFKLGEIGKAVAASMVLFVAVFIVLIVVGRLSRRRALT
ncbi:MAG: sugar ABC transporter permease [Stappiaceae bacterium]